MPRSIVRRLLLPFALGVCAVAAPRVAAHKDTLPLPLSYEIDEIGRAHV